MIQNFKLLGLSLILLISFQVKGQESPVDGGDAKRIINNGTYLGTFQPAAADVDLMPEFKALGNKVNKSQHQEYLAAYKDSLRSIKRAAAVQPSGTSNKTTASIDPVKTFGFNALSNQGTPSDNTIAINENGQIIAAVNSSLRVYNSNGTNGTNIQTFPLFWNPITSKTDMCDPLVHYDTDFDRFIVFTQVCDRGTADNRFLVAFSQTSDPTGAYHYYSFKANLREVIGPSYQYDTWFDYPKMAVSASDLFITGNLFRNLPSNNSTFVESAIFQIDKAACFAGAQPSATVWFDIEGDPFTIVPAGHGLDDNYGDKMHLIATRNTNSASYVRMYTIDGKVTGNPTVLNEIINVPTYTQPADGVQPGTNVDLNTGDMRGMSAMYINGTVHFVFHSNGPGNYVAINYNRFTKNGNNWVSQNKLISIPGVDCAFPSVAAMGWSQYEQSALIVFNYSSLSLNPGIRSIFVDHNMNISNHEELNTGISYASYGVSNGTTRWGDYTGITREHNATTPTVWGFGMYAVSNHTWRNYISKIEIGAWPVANTDIEEAKEEVSVFPNPVLDILRLKLNLKEGGALNVGVYDLQGKKVRDVLNGNVSAGESLFSFNKNGLANGTYLVKVNVNNKLVSNEKIVVAK